MLLTDAREQPTACSNNIAQGSILEATALALEGRQQQGIGYPVQGTGSSLILNDSLQLLIEDMARLGLPYNITSDHRALSLLEQVVGYP